MGDKPAQGTGLVHMVDSELLEVVLLRTLFRKLTCIATPQASSP